MSSSHADKIAGRTGDPQGEGPVADVRTSIECLRKVLGGS